MTERRDRDLVTAGAEAEIDELFRPMQRRVAAFCRSLGDRPMTVLDRVRVMQVVDQELRKIRGDHRGDQAAPLQRLVERRTRQSRRIVYGRVREDTARQLRRLDPELLARIEGRDAQG